MIGLGYVCVMFDSGFIGLDMWGFRLTHNISRFWVDVGLFDFGNLGLGFCLGYSDSGSSLCSNWISWSFEKLWVDKGFRQRLKMKV